MPTARAGNAFRYKSATDVRQALIAPCFKMFYDHAQRVQRDPLRRLDQSAWSGVSSLWMRPHRLGIGSGAGAKPLT